MEPIAIREPIPRRITPEELAGTVWEGIADLVGSGDDARPFQIDAPGPHDNPQLIAGERRVITYRGSGEVLLYNIHVPPGVTLSLSLDGSVRRYSHGDEAGVLRWNRGQSPLRFSDSLVVVVHNTTETGQRYKLHISGA